MLSIIRSGGWMEDLFWSEDCEFSVTAEEKEYKWLRILLGLERFDFLENDLLGL